MYIKHCVPPERGLHKKSLHKRSLRKRNHLLKKVCNCTKRRGGKKLKQSSGKRRVTNNSMNADFTAVFGSVAAPKQKPTTTTITTTTTTTYQNSNVYRTDPNWISKRPKTR